MPLRAPLRLIRPAAEPPFRHVNCRFYRECLNEACTGRWMSWSCTGCCAFDPAAPIAPGARSGADD
ncbi:MAG: hypothetical protein U1A78_40170 [Polyangia bacterium]